MKRKITSFFVFAIFLLFGLFFVDKETALAQIEHSDEVLVKYINKDKVEVRKLGVGVEVDDFIEYLEEDDLIEYVEPNYVYKEAIIPSDTYYDRQWYLKKIKATEAWDTVKGSPNVVIAILDSGVQVSHPDLRENIWRNISEAKNGIDDDKNGYVDDLYGWDFIGNSGDPSPKFDEGFSEAGILHGTLVSGVVAASGNNAVGITGVTWRAQIMSLRVLDNNGEGRTDKVVEAVNYAVEHGADIINLSFVGFGKSVNLEAAIKKAHDKGIIVVAAAGNEQGQGEGYFLDETPMYPACHDGPQGENWVLGVAATDALDQKATFSSYGFKCVDIAAPGVSVYSTSVFAPDQQYDGVPFNKYYEGYWAGTSMAVPMVSGAVALIKSVNPSLSKRNVYKALLEKSDNISRLNQEYLGRLGAGRLNVRASVQYAFNLLNSKEGRIIVVPQYNTRSTYRDFSVEGALGNEFVLFDDDFMGGANLESCDINNDGEYEIIAGAGSGGGPQVRVYKRDGTPIMQFFAYRENFRGGINVACGDLNDDGYKEIVVGSGNSGGPHVRIFDNTGKLRGQFFAYNPNFRGGVNVSVGDVDGDGNSEIVTGSGVRGGPHVRIFNGQGVIQGHFFAFDEHLRYGVNVTVAKIDNDNKDIKSRIIATLATGGEPTVKVFDDHGKKLSEFLAYSSDFRGGVNIAAGDIDNDGYDEVVTGAGIGGSPHVRMFEAKGKFLGAFYAFGQNYENGVNVGVMMANTISN